MAEVMFDTMSFEEMMLALKDKGKDGTSYHKVRGEDLQKIEKKKKFMSFKREASSKYKFLVFGELAFPFNPETGAQDDIYHDKNKFRPLMSAETLARGMKENANKNEAVKAVLMRRAGIKEWDTTNPELTEEDMTIFKKYREPRIFTLPTVSTTLKSLRGKGFQKEYLFIPKRDENNKIVGEYPLILQANNFFVSMAIEEKRQLEEDIKNGVKEMDEAAKKVAIQNIWQKVPVSGQTPANYYLGFVFKLNSKYQINKDSFDIDQIAGFTDEEIHNNVRLARENKGMRTAIESYKAGDFDAFDNTLNWFEIDVAVKTTSTDSKDIGQNTDYEKPTFKLCDAPNYKAIAERLRAYLDTTDDMEDTFLNSMYLTTYDDMAQAALAKALADEIDLDTNEFLTPEIAAKHVEFIVSVFGDDSEAAKSAILATNFSNATDEEKELEAKELSKEFADVNDDFDDTADIDEDVALNAMTIEVVD